MQYMLMCCFDEKGEIMREYGPLMQSLATVDSYTVAGS